ncbi:MAG: hypothetical protein VX938_01420, partial [Myxococcota bacterium]|nr:hypothetical protein [Myxococcota bacterium]
KPSSTTPIAPPLLVLALCSLLVMPGCGGPGFAYDDAPAPGWTHGLLKTERGRITATGSTPVSLQVATDFELARRNALHQVAGSIQAQVAGHTSSYEAHIATGDKTVSEDVVSQTVDLRTRLPVEGAEVVASYRDETTSTAYVLVEVDTSLWAANVDQRLSRTLTQVERDVAQTIGLVDKGDVFGALKSAAEVRAALGASAVDVSVMEVLKPAAKRGADLRQLADTLSGTLRVLKVRTPFAIDVQGGDNTIRDGIHGQLRQFLGKQGFSVIEKPEPGTAMVLVDLSHEDKGAQRVGNRTEYVAVARGSIRVSDSRGLEVPALAFSLSGSMVEERASDPNQAALAAQRLAADTLVSQLRSRFRRLVGSAP